MAWLIIASPAIGQDLSVDPNLFASPQCEASKKGPSCLPQFHMSRCQVRVRYGIRVLRTPNVGNHLQIILKSYIHFWCTSPGGPAEGTPEEHGAARSAHAAGDGLPRRAQRAVAPQAAWRLFWHVPLGNVGAAARPGKARTQPADFSRSGRPWASLHLRALLCRC